MKELMEKRNALIVEMEGLLATAKTETRAFNETETERIEAVKAEIKGIDNTIKVEEELRNMDKKTEVIVAPVVEQRELDDANFLKFVRGEERALDVASNGGVIPVTIANKIIETVKELSPIYSMVTVYNVGGDLVFPVYDEATGTIAAAYSDDLTELVEGTGKFTTIKLTNFIVGTLAKISKSLMNRTDFDLVSFIVRKVAKSIADFLEKELILGTTGKMQGLASTTNLVTSASSTVITSDELLDVQMTVPEVYQAGAVWIMNKATIKVIRKLKDLDGNYLLGTALDGFGWILLGKRVYISENVPVIGIAAIVAFYGDMSGLYLKFAQNVQIQMLMEKYATQHAIGVVGYVECDSAIVETQKIAALGMKITA